MGRVPGRVTRNGSSPRPTSRTAPSRFTTHSGPSSPTSSSTTPTTSGTSARFAIFSSGSSRACRRPGSPSSAPTTTWLASCSRKRERSRTAFGMARPIDVSRSVRFRSTRAPTCSVTSTFASQAGTTSRTRRPPPRWRSSSASISRTWPRPCTRSPALTGEWSSSASSRAPRSMTTMRTIRPRSARRSKPLGSCATVASSWSSSRIATRA